MSRSVSVNPRFAMSIDGRVRTNTTESRDALETQGRARELGRFVEEFWRARLDSNQRPPA
jgi:hypothetical protein